MCQKHAYSHNPQRGLGQLFCRHVGHGDFDWRERPLEFVRRPKPTRRLTRSILGLSSCEAATSQHTPESRSCHGKASRKTTTSGEGGGGKVRTEWMSCGAGTPLRPRAHEHTHRDGRPASLRPGPRRAVPSKPRQPSPARWKACTGDRFYRTTYF
ncbi:hypothetical protein GQ53DRAFT_443566 [Thozetella sp. PMI_491]|nr:hypothetical protein GQ53DRAFT_443566 [Thozetella sp. PMI_491]